MTDRQAILSEARRSQGEAELARKAEKARRRQNIWTVEELDLNAVEAARLAEELRALMD